MLRLVANKEGRLSGFCCKMLESLSECPLSKFNIKKVRDILKTFGFSRLVSRLGLGTFKSRSRLLAESLVVVTSIFLLRLEDFDRDSQFCYIYR